MPESELYSTTRFEGSHRHEVFFGTGNRQKSIKLGLVVFLTPEMHNMSNYGVHFNKAFDYELKQIGQRAAMEKYNWSVDDFRREFGRNYL
ncbi:MAG: hypothetical protein J6A49_10675 [Clostridia bacterium]|nr:hypothetical protein [Clostridia bacterium]